MIVTLLTDFGTADYFVGAMKGALLSVAPDALLVDITHDIPPHDIATAAFTLLAATPAFPSGTVHIAVVDPGVGSDRRAVALIGDQIFVGPDNGIFTHVLDREPGISAFHITNQNLFRYPVSPTFHGRDVFAPVAAALGSGLPPYELGDRISDLVRLAMPSPEQLEDGTRRGVIIHIDRFGNCVTNLERADLREVSTASDFTLTVGAHEIRSLRRFYHDGGSSEDPDAPFVIWGSAGLLEISIRGRSAAERLELVRGMRVEAKGNGE